MKIRKLIIVLVIAIFFMFLVFNLSILKANSNLVIKHFTINTYGIFDTTPENYATLYDFTIADQSSNVAADIAQVKAIKPDFIALLYWNFRAVQNVDWMQTVRDACVANNWFLRDARGSLILTDIGYLVDFGNSAYQAWIANYLNNLVNSYSYDGVYADNNLAWGSDYFWGCGATAINPRTNQPWTDAEVRSAQIDYHKAVKNALGSKLLVCNGIWSGYRFYDHQSAYQEILSRSPLDGFMSESLWHPYVDSTPCIWMSEQQWLDAVNFLIWTQDNFLSGHPERVYIPVVKLALGNQVRTPLPSGATREQMATYAYASALLGVKTGQAAQIYFSTSATGVTFDSKMHQLYNAQIGTPTNDCYMIDGTHVYTRDFSNGKVLVNPTDSSYTVNLGLTSFVNAATSQLVPQIITVPPHTGGVLTVATGPSPNPSPTPSISLQTDNTLYARGYTLTAYIQGINPGSARNVKVNVWFGLPGGGTYMYEMYYTGILPGYYTSPVYVWKSVTIPYSAAVGTYSVKAEMRNPSTNALIDSDTYYFTIT